jgi:hypothetical protein
MLIELFAVELESLNRKADSSCWYAKAMRCSAVKASLLASLDVELDDVLVDDVELDESDVPLMSGGGPSDGGAPSGGPALSR